MESNLKLEVLNIKSFNHLMVREGDTTEAHRYKNLEKYLQKFYNSIEEERNGRMQIGDLVAVHIGPHNQGYKLWLRAVITTIFGKNAILLEVYLLDYGIEKCCEKSAVRRLRRQFGHNYVHFQALNFILTGIRPKTQIKSIEAVKLMESLLDINHHIVWANIQFYYNFGTYFGDIFLDDGYDLAAILIVKKLVDGIHHKDYDMASNSVNCVRRHDLNCKCQAIVEYVRKKEALKQSDAIGQQITRYSSANFDLKVLQQIVVQENNVQTVAVESVQVSNKSSAQKMVESMLSRIWLKKMFHFDLGSNRLIRTVSDLAHKWQLL